MHGTIGAAPRILLTSDAVGGVWRYSLAIAAYIGARGGQCTLAILGPSPSPRQQCEAASVDGCTLIDTGLPLDWTASGPSDMQNAAVSLGGLAQQAHARTVHLHTPVLAAFDWPVPAVAVAHSCVGGWWRAVQGGQRLPPEFAWRMALMREGLERAAAVIAPSRAASDLLGQVYATGRHIEIVHNGLAGTPTLAGKRVRRVLAAGRLWDGGKNFAMLDRAALMLDAPVDAAGPARGPDGAAFSAFGLNLLGNLAQDDLRSAMLKAGVFAAPSIYEPFGLAVLEAAQTGAALALSDIASFRELWEGAAVFIDAHDPGAWAAALRTLLDTPSHAAEMGERARARARRYTARAMAEATIAIHRAVSLQDA